MIVVHRPVLIRMFVTSHNQVKVLECIDDKPRSVEQVRKDVQCDEVAVRRSLELMWPQSYASRRVVVHRPVLIPRFVTVLSQVGVGWCRRGTSQNGHS